MYKIFYRPQNQVKRIFNSNKTKMYKMNLYGTQIKLKRTLFSPCNKILKRLQAFEA